jgi:hypothetical protein
MDFSITTTKIIFTSERRTPIRSDQTSSVVIFLSAASLFGAICLSTPLNPNRGNGASPEGVAA